MTDTITLPRAAADLIEDLVEDLVENAFDDGAAKLKGPSEQTAKAIAALRAALDAALAKPEPTVKDSLTVDRIWSIWLDSWKACGNVPTPVLAEHFARQIERAHGIGLAKPTSKDSLQVASENEVEAMMPRPAKALEFLDGFRDGFRAAERFHGITKGDKT